MIVNKNIKLGMPLLKYSSILWMTMLASIEAFAASEEDCFVLNLSTNTLPYVTIYEREFDTANCDDIRILVSVRPDIQSQCELTTNSQIHVQIGCVEPNGIAFYRVEPVLPANRSQIIAALDVKIFANKTKILIMGYFLPQCNIRSFIAVRADKGSVL